MNDEHLIARTPQRLWGVVPAAAAALLLVAGCGTSAGTTTGADERVTAGTLPSSHIHGVAFDPADGSVLLATHDGLFTVDEDGGSTHIGPVIDLMGFAVTGPGRFVASGHPGAQTDLPDPVGLIESTDGGQTWTGLSREGISDFHALTAGDSGIVGYDGALARSADGVTWEELDFPGEPHTLAAASDGQRVLATTPQGVKRSLDGGRTWNLLDGGPVLQVVAWADDDTTVVGVDTSGQVWVSDDGGTAWQEGARLDAGPQAVAARGSAAGELRIVVATIEAVIESGDGGRTFDVLLRG